MKLQTITILLFFISIFFLPFKNLTAQTQEQIEEMQKNGDNETKDTETKLSKEEKKAKKELDKANTKAKKEADKANKDAEKARKNSSKDLKPKKVKKEKPTKVKKEKIEKTKKNKPTKVKKTSTRSSNLNKPLKSWSVDIGLNTTNPQTDIRYHDFFGTLEPKNEFKYGGQLRVTKMFDNAIGVQMQFGYNRLQGVYDTLVPFREERIIMENNGIYEGLYFRNNVVQASLNLYWNISNTIFNLNRYYKSLSSHKPMKKRWFSLYTYAGIGMSFFDPHVMRLSDNADLTTISTFDPNIFRTDRTVEVVVPTALGAKVKLSKTFDLGLEMGYNFMFTDKLDGLNMDHPKRLKTDGYTTMSMVLSVKLGAKKQAKDHLEWVNTLEPIFEEIAKISKIEKKVKRLAKDEDGDGVSDYFDKDTDTPEGTTVGADGKALDIDRDGIIDDNDMELFSGNNAEVDEQGRALDSDKDGVPDYLDEEDGTAENEPVDARGRTIKIPENSNEGKLRNIALPSIFFDTDRANIKRQYEDELFQMALTIKRNQGLKFVLEGHCDERGSDEYNIELGNRRAEAVKQYLVDNYKLDPSIFTIVSKGSQEMLSPKFRVNRRVDIIIAE